MRGASRELAKLVFAIGVALLPLRDAVPAAGLGPAAAAPLSALPLRFEANRGQADPRVSFLARGLGWSAFLTPEESVVAVRAPGSPGSAVLRLRPVGGAPGAPVGVDRAPGVVHHLRGRTPAAWHTGVATFERVAYRAVWPGIDLVYHGDLRRLEYDFVVAPGADPASIELQVEGADRLAVERGALVLGVGGGRVVFEAPVLHQERDGAREPVDGRWSLRGARRVGFEVAAFDTTRPLVIDPVLGLSTYLGGSGSEDGFDNMGVAVDATGVYVTGTTDSADFPEFAGFQPAKQGFADAFVTKLDPSGTEIVWSTFLGGAGLDSGQALVLDAAGHVYVAGFTGSADFPDAPAPRRTDDRFDAFVAKLSPAGDALLFSRILGGSGQDFALGIDLDPGGDVWISGDTDSADFPLARPVQPALASPDYFDAFVAELDGTTGGLRFSTYLGGSLIDSGQDVEVAADGAIHLAGFTLSDDFPVLAAAQPASGGNEDAFVARLEPDGAGLAWSTYLGGAASDRAIGLGADDFGNVYVAGDTFSLDFPTTLEPFSGFADAFVTKLDAGGTMVWSTALGGDSADVGLALETDASGNSFLTGLTFSLTFPILRGFQGERAGDVDAFVAAYDPDGRRRWSSYLGGSAGDRGLGIARGPDGDAWVVGDTFSPDFPTEGALQPEREGIRDAFVTRVPAVEQRVLADPALRVREVAAGLVEPMSMAFLGPDDLLVLEKDGRIRRVTAGVLDPDPVLAMPVSDVDGGPWGLVLHPGFPATPYAYVYATAVAGDPPVPVSNRVVRFRWADGSLVEPLVIADLPAGPDHGQEGGTLAFGPDGRLYVSVGDVGSGSLAQNVAGGPAADGSSGVLRLAEDGTTPSDNPFVSAGLGFERYHAFGVRGPFAMAFDPETGALWASDNSLGSYDELNRLAAGANAGWSQLVGPTSRAGPPPALTALPGADYVDPPLAWRDPIVPRGMVFLDSDALGEQHRGQLFLGGAADGSLYRLDPDFVRTGFDFEGRGVGDGVVDGEAQLAETVFAIGFGAITDVEVGPDGLVYVLSASLGQVLRLERDAELDLRLTTSATTALLPGDPVPVRLELSNDAAETRFFGLLLTLRSPAGAELAFLGPLDVELPGGGEAVIEDLGVTVPEGASGGRWQVRGTLFRPEGDGAIDLARAEFQVIPEPGPAAAFAALAALAAVARRRAGPARWPDGSGRRADPGAGVSAGRAACARASLAPAAR